MGWRTYQLVHGPLRVAPRGRGGAPVGKEENFHHIAHGRKEGEKEGRKEGRPSPSVPAGLLCIIATVVRETEE